MVKLMIIISMFITSTQLALAAGPTIQKVSLQPIGPKKMQAGAIDYKFRLIDSASKKEISDVDLILSHTKKLHFIAYDAALKEFRHVHPTFNNGSWNATFSLPVDGNYFFWAQGMLGDSQEFSALAKGSIANGKPKNQIKSLADVRSGIDSGTKIVLTKAKIKAGEMATLEFAISRTDGKPPTLSPYLGAFAHVIATSTDGSELIHVHPAAGNKPNTGVLHSMFPSEGSYRLWIQLMDGGDLKTIPLSVSVFK